MTTTETMMASFEQYKREVAIALDAVGNMLTAGRYAEACNAMTAITQRQAKTSTSMRAVLIRSGHLKETDQ